MVYRTLFYSTVLFTFLSCAAILCYTLSYSSLLTFSLPPTFPNIHLHLPLLPLVLSRPRSPVSVQQFDFHLPSLTVRETLRFNALIRLPRSLSLVEKHARVERVIVLLGLRLCSNIRVGGDVIKGISGGEKRRLSLGIQMLADPPVCLLDEPTTGTFLPFCVHIIFNDELVGSLVGMLQTLRGVVDGSNIRSYCLE